MLSVQSMPVELALAHTFTISRESHDVQPSLIVKLTKGEHTGLGETTSNPFYGTKVPEMQAAIEQQKAAIEAHNFEHTDSFHSLLLDLFPDNAFIRCALDMAAHDLYGKRLGKPLYKVWGKRLEALPLSNYTIGIDTIEKMKAKILEKPWPIYKVKLGTDHDLEIVEALRQVTDATFRIDANCAWTAKQTIEFSKKLKELGVEFIEQPLPVEAIDEMSVVYDQSSLPVIADESCQVEADVAKCAGKFHGINIKLTKCGGLTPALNMLKQAEALGLQKMVGCMTESSVGISAIGHLLPFLDYVDMDGAILLKNDVADGVRLENGFAVFPDRPGTGAILR